jgi:hypothetical protein
MGHILVRDIGRVGQELLAGGKIELLKKITNMPQLGLLKLHLRQCARFQLVRGEHHVVSGIIRCVAL